jgi:hypothetical protein
MTFLFNVFLVSELFTELKGSEKHDKTPNDNNDCSVFIQKHWSFGFSTKTVMANRCGPEIFSIEQCCHCAPLALSKVAIRVVFLVFRLSHRNVLLSVWNCEADRCGWSAGDRKSRLEWSFRSIFGSYLIVPSMEIHSKLGKI